MLSQTALKTTPLHEEHCTLGARMVPFAGWEMPLQYDGILAEYDYTRKGVAVFDTSHMGEYLLEGDYQKSGLDKVVTVRLQDMLVKSCRYGLMLNSKGGTIDDLIVYRIAEDNWMIVVNAALIEQKADHFIQHLTKGAHFQDISHQTGKLDIQGPRSREILSSLVAGIEKLDYYTFDYFPVLGEKVIVSRTGYTGELGYEIYFPWTKTQMLWKELLNNKAKPAGLGVRDVLRIEMGYSLYGHELSESITPWEAGLGKFVDLEKEFIGKDALLEQQKKGVGRKIAYFASVSRRSPRGGQKIFSEDFKKIGEVTSGTFSPSLLKGIGMGFVVESAGERGREIHIGEKNNTIEAQITTRPFYKNGSIKN